mgnify:CR=1 FL=1
MSSSCEEKATDLRGHDFERAVLDKISASVLLEEIGDADMLR